MHFFKKHGKPQEVNGGAHKGEVFEEIPLSEPKPCKGKQVKGQLDDLVFTLRDNISLVAQRGESMQSIESRTSRKAIYKSVIFNIALDEVSESSRQFRKGAVKAKKRLWWKHWKMNIMILLLLIILVAALICTKLGPYLYYSNSLVLFVSPEMISKLLPKPKIPSVGQEPEPPVRGPSSN